MKIDLLKVCFVLMTILCFCSCSHKTNPKPKASTTAEVPEENPGGSNGEIDHLPSPNSEAVAKCLEQFFNDNPIKEDNALMLGVRAIHDCNAKPGDLVMFLQQHS